VFLSWSFKEKRGAASPTFNSILDFPDSIEKLK
jgi:hypothetical protein